MPLPKQVLLKFMQAVLTLFYQDQLMDNIQNQPLRSWWCWIRFILPEDWLIDKIEQISIAKPAEAIVRIHENRPLPYLKSKCQKQTIRRLGNSLFL